MPSTVAERLLRLLRRRREPPRERQDPADFGRIDREQLGKKPVECSRWNWLR